MGLEVTSNGSRNRKGSVTKLEYVVQSPGADIVIPANSFITWMILYTTGVVPNPVTINTVPAGALPFFDDVLQPGIPYETSKGWQVLGATTLRVVCAENVIIKFYKF